MNEYIKNTVLKEIADIVESIKKDPINAGTDLKIKSMANKIQAKVAEVILVKRDGIITQNVLDANLIKYVLVSTFNTKVKEIEDKIPDISNLVNKTQLTTVENTVVKKTDFNTELKKINDDIVLNKNEIKKYNHQIILRVKYC